MTIVAIWCRHKDDNIIGVPSGLPWRVPSDTRRFRNLTDGKIKVMGRKTYEIMPQKVLAGQPVIVLCNDAEFEVFDEENHIVFDDADKLKDYPQDLYVSGGATVYTKFLTTPQIMPNIVVDCVYGGEISVETKGFVEISKCVDILKEKYLALPYCFELDNVTTTIWLKKGDFIEQSIIKNILQYLETEK